MTSANLHLTYTCNCCCDDPSLTHVKERLRVIEFDLLCSDTESEFYTDVVIESADCHSLKTARMCETNTTFYYDRPTKRLLRETLCDGRREIVEDTSVNEWTLTYRPEKVGTYNCLYAKGVKHLPDGTDLPIEAWYSELFPLPFGPSSLYGLPGLILRGRIGKLDYEATMVERLHGCGFLIEPPAIAVSEKDGSAPQSYAAYFG